MTAMTDSRPVITMIEWMERNGVESKSTVTKWAQRGYLSGAYQSPPIGGIWLIPATTPVPDPPKGGQAHEKARRPAREKKIIEGV